ncbi:UNVERIFIED_CONTAM: hypothetical protein K2H54_045190 [Gekko kuhli]
MGGAEADLSFQTTIMHVLTEIKNEFSKGIDSIKGVSNLKPMGRKWPAHSCNQSGSCDLWHIAIGRSLGELLWNHQISRSQQRIRGFLDLTEPS